MKNKGFLRKDKIFHRTRLLQVGSGKDDLDVGGILMDSAVDAGIGALLGKFIPVPINGITAGRNSFNAVFKSTHENRQ